MVADDRDNCAALVQYFENRMTLGVPILAELTSFIAALTVLATAIAAEQAVTYGTLAPGAISIAEQSGVRAEICRDHLIDPADIKMKIPASYRLLNASALAKDDPGLAALLANTPRYGNHFVGSLCFMLIENYDVDGVRVISQKASPMAFWWVHAERVGEADPRMQGKSEWLQLASWYADKDVDRAGIAKSDPMAEFVPIDVDEAKSGIWRVRLKHGTETVEATISVTGEPQRRKSPQPGFMTVGSTGESARYFTVFTYFGHHHQTAEGIWAASGGGVFSRAFGVPDEAAAFGTFFQSRWQARAALYEFNR